MSEMQRRPVPPVKAKSFGKAQLVQAAIGGVGGAVGMIALMMVARDKVDAVMKSIGLFEVMLLPIATMLAMAVHEIGHMAFALAAGMRFSMLSVWPVRIARTRAGIRASLTTNLGAIGGFALAIPTQKHSIRAQLAAMVAGGPVTSLVAGAAGLWLAQPLDGLDAFLVGAFGVFSLLLGVVNSLPFRAGGMMTDGMQLIDIGRGGRAVAQRNAVTSLWVTLQDGTRPRDLPQAQMDAAIALIGNEPVRDVATFSLLYQHALDAGRLDEAATWLDRVEAMFEKYPDGFRQALALELAYFEAFHRGDVARADAWMLHAKGGVVDAARRKLAEAAVARAHGDLETAQVAIEAARVALGKSIESGAVAMTTDQIEALAATLEARPAFSG